ncbi:MAG: hypothetical protein ACK5AO_01665, partial [bacterium]
MTNSLFFSAGKTITRAVQNSLKSLVVVGLLLISINGQAQTTKTIPAGSFIVNMGVTPQTVGNGLKPYGLLYDLLKNYQTPVIWSIKPDKATQTETDFIAGLVEYKSGAFIIEEQYRTTEVNARIAYWQTQGVVGATTTTAVTVPVYLTFKYAPYWVMDKDNGSIAAKFFVAAGIPATAHGGASDANWKDPKDLDVCDDLFVLPHADPTWPVHKYLLTFVDSLNGNIWSGCHAASALENLVNPADRTVQTNFLTKKNPAASLRGTGTYANSNSLILWGDHADGTQPFTNRLFSDPVAQFIGSSDAAQDGGSEQIYIPKQDTIARWNPGAKIITYDPTQSNVPSLKPDLSNAAAVNVYGRAYDSENHGYVFYQGGHDISGNAPENVAAQRMFFNFSLFSLQDKLTARLSVQITGTQPQMLINQPYQLNAIATSAGAGLTYLWRSNYGTFSDTTIANPVFTPNIATENASITCIVADLECQRSSVFETYSASVEPTPIITAGPAVTLTDVCENAVSSTSTFTLSGFNLNANVDVTAPQGFEVSLTSNSGYAQTISVPYNEASGTISSTLVYVRLSSTATPGVKTGAVSITYLQGAFGTVTATANVIASPIVPAYTLTQPDCDVATGTFSITSSLTDVTYTLVSSSTVTNTSGLFTGLTSGSYSLTITNNTTGCISIPETFPINPQPIAASATATKTDVLCNGGTTGAISLTVSGGTLPYSYNWSNGETTKDITGLAAGTYSVTITEGGGCTTIVSVTLSEPATVLSGTISTTNVLCKGASTGSLDLTPSGGAGSYSYAWTGPNAYSFSNQDPTGLVAGNYSVTITDANNCTAVVTTTITEPANAFSATISSTASTICATEDVTLTTSGGGSYFWSNNATTSSITVSPAVTSSYTVTVTSADNCTATASYTITVNPLPTITSTVSSVCVSKTIDLNSSDAGGTWTTASSTIATVDVLGVVTGLSEGTVTIT